MMETRNYEIICTSIFLCEVDFVATSGNEQSV